jgi:hypothetical protein
MRTAPRILLLSFLLLILFAVASVFMPPGLFAQAVDTTGHAQPVHTWSVVGMLLYVFPFIQAALVRTIMHWLKVLNDAVDRWPAWAQQVAVIVISALLGAVQYFTGVALGNDLANVDAAALGSALAVALAMVTHNGSKLSKVSKVVVAAHPAEAHPLTKGKHSGGDFQTNDPRHNRGGF